MTGRPEEEMATETLSGPYPDLSFDKMQLDCLKHLAEVHADVYIPFYANTFPLGYHYSRLTSHAQADVSSGRVIRHVWADPIPEQIFQNPRRVSVLFGSAATLKEIRARIAGINAQSGDGTFQAQETFFTRYQPKCFFHRHNRSSVKILENESDARDDFDLVEVFTDVPEQATIVEKYLRSVVKTTLQIRIVGDFEDGYILKARTNRTLPLYFYGAPLTTALLANERYVKVSFPPGLWPEDQFLTYCIIVAPTDINVSEMSSCLGKYHRQLFSFARTDCKSLRNVWWAYNRAAYIMRNPPRFKSEAEYAQCLTDHHAPSEGQYIDAKMAMKQLAADAPPSKERIHVHFGLGPLSVGFVLGLLTASRVIVIQRSGDTAQRAWRQRKNGQLRLINSSRDYNHRFKIYRQSPAVDTLLADDSIVIFNYDDQNEKAKILELLTKAGSISVSCRNGQDTVLDLLLCAGLEQLIPVYWIENKFSNRIEPENRINSIRCIPDRICTLNNDTSKGVRGQMNIQCEEYFGELLVPTSDDTLLQLFGSNLDRSVYSIKPGAMHFQFYYRRKRYLVNGLHALVAVLSYNLLLKWGVEPALWKDMPAPIFLRALIADSGTSYQLKCYRYGQILRLIAETDPSALRETLGSSDPEDQFYQLLHRSDGVVRRMNRTIDYFGRLLDISKINKASRSEVAVLKTDLREIFQEHFNDAMNSVNIRRDKIMQLPIREAPSVWDISTNLSEIVAQCNTLIDNL